MRTLESSTRKARSFLAAFPIPLALLLVVQPLARAATITTGPGCTLIDAINAANSDSAVGTCEAGSGADTIVLTEDVVLTAVDNTTDGANGLPSITTEMTIDGDGSGIERGFTAPNFRILHIGSSGELTLQNTTVSGGSARGGEIGGGIYNRGVAILDSTSVTNNHTHGLAGYSGGGGGIANLAELSLINGTQVSGNFVSTPAGYYTGGSAVGGGILNYSGDSSYPASLTIDNSTVTNNSVGGDGPDFQRPGSGYGGGISSAGSVVLINSTVSGNTAFSGGYGNAGAGGMSSVGETTIINSTFAQNEAGSNEFAGAGALRAIGTVTVSNSTFSGNLVSGGNLSLGGAVISSAVAYVDNVTFYGNQVTATSASGGTWSQGSNPATFTNTIVASSTPGPPDDCSGGTFTDGGGNFGCLATAPAVTGLSATLASNGGPTQTHALEAGSNALNVGGECDLKNDQRGIGRLGDCDSGAYEYNPCTADDAFETTGGHGNDDTCTGNQLTLGTAQSHLHCDEDWVYFTPDVGKTYEVTTTNLTGGADTVLEVFEECVTAVDSDDNGAAGAASRVVLTASALQHDVRITETWDSYNPGSSPPTTTEGYDVLVRCIEGCDCTPPDGPDLELSNDSVSTAVTYEVCGQVTVYMWEVEPSGAVVIRAGDSVVFDDAGEGVTIEGELQVEIDPSLLPPP